MTFNKKQIKGIIAALEHYLPNLEADEVSYDILVEYLAETELAKEMALIIEANKGGHHERV